MIVQFVDGTYGLIRHFYGLCRVAKGKGPLFPGVVGVWQSVLQTNYKTAASTEPAPRAQFYS